MRKACDKKPGEFKYFALKVLKKKELYEKSQMENTILERKILMEVKHTFIVQLHYAFQSHDRFFFVIDYVNGGDLFNQLKKRGTFREKEAKFFAAELALALNYLHQKGFIYRDLKPENVLIDEDGHVKLTDFGLSK